MLKQILESCDDKQLYQFVKHKVSTSGPLGGSILFLSQTKQMQRAVMIYTQYATHKLKENYPNNSKLTFQ